MHVQCFEDMKCFLNYGKSNWSKEYRLSNEERNIFMSWYSSFMYNEILWPPSSGESALSAFGWESHFAVVNLDWNPKHQLFFQIASFLLHLIKRKPASPAFSFVMHISLRELWHNDVILWKSQLGFGVIIISDITLQLFLISQFRETHIWGLNDTWNKTVNVPLKTTDKS